MMLGMYVSEMSVSDMAIDGSNPGSISMLCPRAKHFIHIASVDLAVK